MHLDNGSTRMCETDLVYKQCDIRAFSAPSSPPASWLRSLWNMLSSLLLWVLALPLLPKYSQDQLFLIILDSAQMFPVQRTFSMASQFRTILLPLPSQSFAVTLPALFFPQHLLQLVVMPLYTSCAPLLDYSSQEQRPCLTFYCNSHRSF